MNDTKRLVGFLNDEIKIHKRGLEDDNTAFWVEMRIANLTEIKGIVEKHGQLDFSKRLEFETYKKTTFELMGKLKDREREIRKLLKEAQ